MGKSCEEKEPCNKMTCAKNECERYCIIVHKEKGNGKESS